MTAARRLLVVSNRLPVTARIKEGAVTLHRASGGLATGLRSWHERSGGLWIGWPGDVSRFTVDQLAALEELLGGQGVVPVYLSADDIERFYEGFSNRVLWPLFHYLVDRVPVEPSGWDAYRRVNERFARAVVDAYRPGDAIWVHDYQLMLVPALVRSHLPDARIGFFLHVPFPSSEVFRILPWRREILDGLVGADLLGFHTFAYLRHFVASLLHVQGIEADVSEVRIGDRLVRLGVFPMGIDAASFDTLARDPEVVAEAAAIRNDAGGRRILLGIDRLDYTKGIPRRLSAVERMLTRHPSLRDTIRYIQIAVPSRGTVDSYQRFRRRVEEAVGRINGDCGTLRSTPIHYMHRSVPRRQMVALFCAADVMLVTPLRDGMNLVAKEFVASRADGDGVLVLSEFAGAAAELGEAVVVNPYDVDALAATIYASLEMAPAERRARMRNLRRRVLEHDVHWWAGQFIERLNAEEPRQVSAGAGVMPPSVLDELCHTPRLAVLLDYDGTLVPLAKAPELAVPDPEILSLLEALASCPDVDVHVLSGRPRDGLEDWLGQLPLSLWAEHGFWFRPAPAGAWRAATTVPPDWSKKVSPILEQFTAGTPGSLIEEKTASVAWHYRIAHAEFGARQAHELRMLLGDALSNQPLEVLEGKKVIEVRLRGISKALVAERGRAALDAATAILAIGDDRSDEELFAALPALAVTVAVGLAPSGARFRLRDHRAVRELLDTLLAARRPAAARA